MGRLDEIVKYHNFLKICRDFKGLRKGNNGKRDETRRNDRILSIGGQNED